MPEPVIRRNVGKRVFAPNKFPYAVPAGCEHYVLWYISVGAPPPEENVCNDIESEIKTILGEAGGEGDTRTPNQFEYIWYDNPKPTMKRVAEKNTFVYHVQVFWVRGSDDFRTIMSDRQLSYQFTPFVASAFINRKREDMMEWANDVEIDVSRSRSRQEHDTELLKIRLLAFGCNFVGWFLVTFPNVYTEEEEVNVNAGELDKAERRAKDKLFGFLYTLLVAGCLCTFQGVFHYIVGSQVGKLVGENRQNYDGLFS